MIVNLNKYKEATNGMNLGKVILVMGKFNILNAGHVKFLEAASSAGKTLVVGLLSDSIIRIISGASYPIVPYKERSYILDSCKFVDFVIMYNGVEDLIREVDPDMLLTCEKDKVYYTPERKLSEELGFDIAYIKEFEQTTRRITRV